MSHRNNSRIERFAQMSKQEELIAKKRQEILEKQRTTELAKAVAAAQSLAAKLKTNEDCLQTKEKSDDDVTDSKTSDVESSVSTTTVNIKPLNILTGKIGKTVNLKRPPIMPLVTEHPSPKIQNTFCNDGSFLENFKKILEKQQQPHPLLAMCQQMNVNASASNPETIQTNTVATSNNSTLNESNSSTATNADVLSQPVSTTIIPPPPTPPNPVPFAFNPALVAAPSLLLSQTASDTNSGIPPPPLPVHTATAYYASAAPAPPPPPTTVSAAVAAAAMLMPMDAVTAATAPPPPPPPQLPLPLSNLAPLYMIPPPQSQLPQQLNTIQKMNEYDLNSLSNEKLNLEPSHLTNTINNQQIIQQDQDKQQQQQQQHEHPQQQQNNNEQYSIEINSSSSSVEFSQQGKLIDLDSENSNINLQENTSNFQISPPIELSKDSEDDGNTNNANDIDGMPIQIPTTLENLIDMVADKGDAYEETLRSHKTQLHPVLWFLCDKNCEQYLRYRQQVIDRRKENLKEQQMKEAIEKRMMKSTLSHKQRQMFKDDMEEDKYDPESVISADNDSDDEYRRGILDRNRDNIKRRIECRNELAEEERQEQEAAELESLKCKERKKMRKSRWGGKVELANSSLTSSSVASSFGNQNKPLLSTITNNDPALLQYAKLNYGSTNLSEEEWNKCKEHYKVNLLYQDMMRKRQEIDRLAHSGKFKYEYDSDEDVDGGTWEHKLRQAEMEATRAWAQALTKQSEGKHHIGDFLPPEELKKFMEQYEAKKYNRQPDLSDYKEYKLRADNKGFQMLQKLGWKEGQGLGQDGEGIVEPINKGPQREGNQGLGVQNSATPEECDNEYDAYRKRMMLAYRFRPNPLNNPRRAYY